MAKPVAAKKVVVIGTGYVGLTTAVLLAHSGHKVYALDINKDRLDAIAEGRSFFHEEGIDPLIESAVKNKHLIPTDSYEEVVPGADIVFSSVGTPDNPDGSPNLSYVYSAAEQAGALMDRGAIFVQKSTVPVGTGRTIIDTVIDPLDKKIRYVSNPEFLREGTALSDSLYFDRVVVGGDHHDANKEVIALYKDMEAHAPSITKKSGIKPREAHNHYVSTSLNSAELIKVTANAFLAMKISFANSIAKLADEARADVLEVMSGVGLDQRIGQAFLNAGRGYGGGCFPKDVSGLISAANEHGVDLHIMNAVVEVNGSMPGYIVNRAKERTGDLEGRNVAVLGLAFKAGTSDARKSPAVEVANSLAHENAKVTAYDPHANEEARPDLNRNVKLATTLEKALANAEVVFVATDWPEFKTLDYSKYTKGSMKLVVDCMNAIDPEHILAQDLEYLGVGRGLHAA